MSDEDLKTLLPGDDDFERALDQSDHERAKRAIMADPHVRGTLAELREELRAGEMPFRYRPDRPDRPRSDRPEPMGPDSKRERDTVRGLGNPASQSTPPPPMVAEAGADGADEYDAPAAPAPISKKWSPNDAVTRPSAVDPVDMTVGGRTARLKAAEAPPSSRTPTPADADPDAQDLTRADRRAVAAPAERTSPAADAHEDDADREITGAGSHSTSPWTAPLLTDADRTPPPRNPLDEKDTIRNLPPPRGRGLGTLVAGACLACAFVAVIALATARTTPIAMAHAGITVPHAPAWQPPPPSEASEASGASAPDATQAPGAAAPPPAPARTNDEPAHTAPTATPEHDAHPTTSPVQPASSSDRWF